MKPITIELFNSQCSVRSLWEFIEDNLYIARFPSPMFWITEREIKARQENKNIFLAISNGIVVGCIVFKRSNIEVLCVKRRYRKNGIGKKLIEHIELVLKGDKRRKNLTVSTLDNFNAKRFYERMGFETIGNKGCDHTWHMKKGLYHE